MVNAELTEKDLLEINLLNNLKNKVVNKVKGKKNVFNIDI